MALYQSDRTIAFWHAYGKAAPPEKLTQEAFEGNDRHLRRLLRIKTGERPDVQDLWEYLQDLRHTDIQGSLLAYLLPFCLELWCEDLRGTSDKYGGFVEHLYPVLTDRAIFDKHLTIAFVSFLVWCLWCLFEREISTIHAEGWKQLQQARPWESPISMRFSRMLLKT